ncbi:Hypothetical predicted protein [Olea europaea subsp. europaea]|uniref:Uncharacterized protein n=1 Tax=Olea europaea subsp. europaea TaxID=158383 RepID=A0A8S0TSE9_OLEEU|nr:Hypothetical predicted protein [Olea europaea subsp. europaea]
MRHSALLLNLLALLPLLGAAGPSASTAIAAARAGPSSSFSSRSKPARSPCRETEHFQWQSQRSQTVAGAPRLRFSLCQSQEVPAVTDLDENDVAIFSLGRSLPFANTPHTLPGREWQSLSAVWRRAVVSSRPPLPNLCDSQNSSPIRNLKSERQPPGRQANFSVGAKSHKFRRHKFRSAAHVVVFGPNPLARLLCD